MRLRELGIPAISNVVGLTQALRTGQVAAVDGRTGDIVPAGVAEAPGTLASEPAAAA